MYSKALALLLLLFGLFLMLGGAGAIAMSEPFAPMLLAMLSGLVVFGLMCLAAAYGVYKGRTFGFVICLVLGASAAAFALFVAEPMGHGLLWPTVAFMAANGAYGVWFSRNRRASQEAVNG